jgi:hypothetical protein
MHNLLPVVAKRAESGIHPFAQCNPKLLLEIIDPQNEKGLAMFAGIHAFCTCDKPHYSHVRPGVCYACWKIIRDQAPPLDELLACGEPVQDGVHFVEDDLRAVMQIQRSMC